MQHRTFYAGESLRSFTVKVTGRQRNFGVYCVTEFFSSLSPSFRGLLPKRVSRKTFRPRGKRSIFPSLSPQIPPFLYLSFVHCPFRPNERPTVQMADRGGGGRGFANVHAQYENTIKIKKHSEQEETSSYSSKSVNSVPPFPSSLT